MLVVTMIPNLFGCKLSTWVKSHKLLCVFNIVTIHVFCCLFRKSAVIGTWKVNALFQIRVALVTGN